MIHTTPDNFVWLDITHRCKDNTFICLVWSLFDLYAVRSDDSESLLEDMATLQREREDGSRICIEVGHVGRPNQHWFKEADKKLIDGYWYVKVNDIRFG